MRPFDTIAIVDWSGGNDTGARPRKDAIWAAVAAGGVAETPVYLRNRAVAEEWLADLIDRALVEGRRLLVGFDFPFGYPSGFSRAITGSADPLALWAFFAGALEDRPGGNNRFALAGVLNARFPGEGPFWFNGGRDDIAHLPRKKPQSPTHGLPERRACEALAKGAFTCWQMGGAGAVGGQVMTGLAVLQRLRLRFADRIAVWPFEPLDRDVAFVEVWPSLIAGAIRPEPGEIKDSAQVRVLSRAVSRLEEDELAAMLDVPDRLEGWILGLGHEATLERVAA